MLRRKTLLKTRTPLAAMSERRRSAFEAAGIRPGSTLDAPAGDRKPVKPRRRRNTGPSQAVRALVAARSGGVCEWPGCGVSAVDVHHRLNRKMGGRRGETHALINTAPWLLHACRLHHAYVTSPSGEARQRALAWGWLLTEGQDAARTPVMTRHCPRPVLLRITGAWITASPGRVGA